MDISEGAWRVIKSGDIYNAKRVLDGATSLMLLARRTPDEAAAAIREMGGICYDIDGVDF